MCLTRITYSSSPWSLQLSQYGKLEKLLIFLISVLMLMQQHMRHVAATTITSDKSSLTDENSTFSVELPKPLLMFGNRKLKIFKTVDDLVTPHTSQQTSKRQQHAISHRPSLMDVALQVSAREGLVAMTELYGKIVPNIVRNGHLLEHNHPAALLSKFSESTSETLEQEMAAYATISATKAFRKNYKYFNDLARQAHTTKISLRHTALEGLCPPRDPPTCMPASARYRTHDGTCNSRRRPRWGAAQMPFNRFLPPEYGDGVDSVRMSVDGGPLASSRFVSLLVHGARDGEAGITLMTAQWGQLLDHDMTSTAQPRSINGSVPSCCGNTDFHPSCFPIKVPLDDPWLAPLKVRCLEFLRSAPAQRRDCILSWREQTNQATSYIDASPIYSNSVKSSDSARVFRNGLLIFGRGGNPAEDVCHRGAIATNCIRAGDGRSGEQPGLLALHHVWVGEHNRIAMELSEMNLHWSDEKIYQEARRIVGAMFQHITYREFLPIVLGREVCKLFDLELVSNGYYEGYDAKTNPTVANSFAAAAFRFGHSLVQNSYMRCDRFHNFMRNNVSLHEEFQRGDVGSPGSLHRLIRGLVNQRALKRDEFITPELTNHLFQTPGFPFGLDLAAINIQRGRDHGVPAYTAWRVPCGLTPINNWDEFANVVGPQSAHRISHAYRSVHDIDLFVGGIAERPVVGGLVGPTFACIIAQQFSNSRKGDRFWYENGGFENSFTPAQLNSIRRVSLAQILCRAVGGGTMQPHAFLPAEVTGNERQVCGTGILAPIDLSSWIERDPFTNIPTPTTTKTTPTQDPDRVFEVVAVTDGIKETVASAAVVQVVKDTKIDFTNRPRPVQNILNAAASGSNGFIQGVQVPGVIIRISDKLDLKQKPTPVKRPIIANAKPVKGINNKLDKDPPKLTPNIRRRPQATRRTTVTVNNIPVEVRSATETADETGQTKNSTKLDANLNNRNTQRRNESLAVDEKAARIDDLDKLSKDVQDIERVEDHKLNETLGDRSKRNNTAKIKVNGCADNRTNETKNEYTTAKERNNTMKEENTTNERSETNKDEAKHQNSSAKEVKKKADRQSKTELEPREEGLDEDTENTNTFTNTELNILYLGKRLKTKRNNKTVGKETDTLSSDVDGTLAEENMLTNNDNNKTLGMTANENITDEFSDIVQGDEENKNNYCYEKTPKHETRTITDTNDARKDNETTTKSNYKVLIEELANELETTKLSKMKELSYKKKLSNKDEQSNDDYNRSTATDQPDSKLTITNRTETNETVKLKADDNETDTEEGTKAFESEQTTADINPLTQKQTIEEQKRSKRRRTDELLPKLIVVKVPNLSNDAVGSKLHARLTAKTASVVRLATTDTPLKNLTTRSTNRLVELRQYQTLPPFQARPHKVVVNGPNADQYEIEINIRQTNKQTPPSSSTNPYVNYPTTYKPFDRYDRYSSNYVGTYYPNKPTVSTNNVYATRRTRPPTIIYVNEPEDRYTTRSPGLFQSLLTYGNSGGFGGNFNKQQQSSPHSTPNLQKEQYQNSVYGAAHVPSNFNEVNQIYSPTSGISSSSHYAPRPGGTQSQSLPAYSSAPSAISLSQISGVPGNGGGIGGAVGGFGGPGGGSVVQASSSAISTGNFGSITGTAQANGADSTFSFNIRPRPNPSGVGQSELPQPLPINEINAAGYGLLPAHSNFGQLPNPSFGSISNAATATNGDSHYGNANKPNSNSPFSNGNKRPQQETYYGYRQKGPLQKKSHQDDIEVETGTDYDEIAVFRTLEPLTKENFTEKVTKTDDADKEKGDETEKEDDNERDYDYNDDSLELSEKFDRDGYIRPELVIQTLIKSKENELKNLTNNQNCTTAKQMDDNYVLPILNTSTLDTLQSKNLKKNEKTETTENPLTNTTTVNVTNFPDIMGKNLNKDIFAEDDYEDKLTEALLTTQTKLLNTSTFTEESEKHEEKRTITEQTETHAVHMREIAFAPIKILNKLERPDNWVIYDAPNNYTQLPELPEMRNEDLSAPANDIPKPFQGLASIWLKKFKRDKERNRDQFFVNNVAVNATSN